MEEIEKLRRRLSPRPEGRCLIGISGGADSVALLTMLIPMRDEGKITLEAAHVNHGMRGAESDGDEEFVRALCGEHRIPLHTARLDMGDRKDENTARRGRYAAFEEIMRRENIATLILAHQREDQAETLLMRMMRGAGPEGLRAMRAREEREGYELIRPMLNLSGREIRQALEAEGIPWREDRTNRETHYLRNRIRKEILPRMEEWIPGATERLARAAELIGQDGEALDARAETILRAHSGPGWIGTEALREEKEAIRSRVIRRWWKEQGPEREEHTLSYDQTRRMESLLEAPPGETVNMPAGWRARRRKDRIILIPEGRKEEKK